MSDYTDLISRLRICEKYDPDQKEAADALEAKDRRISELRKEADMMHSEYKTARARIAELKAALKPFADAGSFTKTYEYSEDTEMAIPFTWGQLRAARAAYLGEKE
jgi:hypothetical protein